MRLPESLRLRIQIWYGFLLAAVLCVFAFAAYKYQQANNLRQADDQISHRMRVLLKVLPPPPPPSLDPPQFTPPPRPFRIPGSRASLFDSAEAPSYYYILWNQDGSLRTASKSAPKYADYPALSDEETHHTGERTRGEFRESFSFLASGECLLVGRSISTDLAELRAYAKWLAAISIGVLILGLAIGWAIATRSLHSVSLISETAKKIASGSLSERIRIREKHSELGILAHTLNETFSKIEDSFARQHQFVADAAHELRTPVAIILTQAQQTLSRERDSEVYRKALESCISAARRLRTLTDALLELAMHEAGVSPPKRNPCDLAELIKDAAEHFGPLFKERGLELVLDLETARCDVDTTQINQLLLNLVSNAADHTPAGGRVCIRSHHTASTAVLSVSDDGEGIHPDVLPRIFDRFFRADSSRSRKTGGAGLGLAICKAIAKAHQATLGVTSSPGQGTTFTLELPGAPLPDTHA
jgi:two-component system OmpR family sensor kinase